MKTINTFLASCIWIPLMLIDHTLISSGEDSIRVNGKSQNQVVEKKEKKPLDERLYQPKTLKFRCLKALQSQDWSSAPVPEEVRIGAIAFKKIHNNNYCADDLKNAFHLLAPTSLQEKVSSIDLRTQRKCDELEPIDKVIYNQKFLSIFDNLFLILETDCFKKINKGLMQLARDEYRKRKVLYAILLHLGADINYYGTLKDGIRLTTPLITATIHNRVSCVELLLKNKADIHRKEEDGYTAYTLAKQLKNNGNEDLINLLRLYGGFFIPVNQSLNDIELEPELSFGELSYNVVPGACSIQ